jgi:hypothetical protein
MLAMIRSSRPQRFGTWLALVALLLNSVMPTAHASAMARAGADPLLVAFCGQLSPALLAQIEQSSPETYAALKAGALRSGMPGCALCASLHAAGPLAVSTPPPLMIWTSAAIMVPQPMFAGLPLRRGAIPPPARAPPDSVSV